MSWIVQRLLMETVQIKETHDFDSNDYNRLLIIEKKISDMIHKDMFSPQEVKILNLIREGYLFVDIELMIGLGRETVSKTYKNICERIAFSLGGEFTNDGFILELAKENKLSKDQQELLTQFVNNKLRHKILRRPIEQNDK